MYIDMEQKQKGGSGVKEMPHIVGFDLPMGGVMRTNLAADKGAELGSLEHSLPTQVLSLPMNPFPL
ncbi:hypothetical protein ACEQPO_06605 [Bacillus sp. SL00103]